MSQSSSSSQPAAQPTAPATSTHAERRTNAHLRELVDEMLASIRVAVGRDLWTEEERREAEAAMARVMSQVRAAAIGRRSASGRASDE